MRFYRKICSVTIILSLLITPNVNATTNTTTVAPNLMIIFSTAFSMHREMDDSTYPRIDTDNDGVTRDDYYRFDDGGFDQWNPGNASPAPAPWNSSGTFLRTGLHGNQPDSKLYQSKKAFLEILNNDSLTGDINIGFSTFRQMFGLSMATMERMSTATYPEVLPPGGNPFANLTNRGNPADPASLHPTHPAGNDIFKASTPDKNVFASDMTNFSSMKWWRQWFDWKAPESVTGNDYSNSGLVTPCAYPVSGSPMYGNPALGGASGKYYETGRGFLDDSFTTFLDNNGGDGGLPLRLKYRSGAKDQSYSRTECSIDGDRWPWGVRNVTGARSQAEVDVNLPVIEHYLCRVSYNSQMNRFVAFYNANRPYRHAYPGVSSGYGLRYSTPDGYLFDANGLLVDRAGDDRSISDYVTNCASPLSAQNIITQTARVSDQLRAWGPLSGNPSLTPAYFSQIPYYWMGVSANTTDAEIGAMTGWSGKTIYKRDCDGAGVGTDECMTASYPSGVTDPCDDSRNLCPNTTDVNDPDKLYRYVKTMGEDLPSNSRHMGIFLDLPDPALGYADNRAKIKGFMGYQQMGLDGNDYNPATQTIAGSKGIAASSHPWQANQSPIYQSLMSAYAYFSAYKEADTLYDSCRSNNILLFYDGKEDARWETVDGNRVYAKPEEIAAKLYDDLGVRVHVVIMSNNIGDIDQANLIAANGNPTVNGSPAEAYVAGTPQELKNALSSTLSTIGLSGEVSEVAPAIPTVTKAGSKVFLAGSEQSPSAGHLRAYEVDNNDALTLSWDAADQMTVAERKSRLWSTKSDGDLKKFKSLDDAAFVASGTPTVATIKKYTLDPSYDNEAYLLNRKYSSLLGTIGENNYTMALGSPSDPALWRDSDYRTYVKARKLDRIPLVLTSSDDGFLYAFKQSDGDLLWGWTPRSIVKHMQTYSTFQFGNYMDGRFYAVDARKKSGDDYKTYIVGAARSGAMYYSLRLKDNGKLKKMAWSEEYTGHTSPGDGEPQLWRHDSKVYAIYVVNNGAGASTLVIRNVAKKSDEVVVTGFSFKITAVPLISGDDEIYLGDENGNVYRTELLDGSGVLKADSVLLADLNLTTAKLGNFVPATFPSSELTYLGITTSSDEKRYLRTQSTSRLTIFREDYVDHDSNSATADVPVWRRAWTSSSDATNNAGSWDADGDYTADSTGSLGTDTDGYFTLKTTGIPSLPPGAVITDAAALAGDAVVLPVALALTTGACSSLDVAYYYLYDLATGQFPDGKFGSRDRHIHAGFGEPNRVSLTTTGPNKIDLIPNAPQKTDNTTGVMDGIEVTGGQRSGRNSWRELIQ